MKFSGNKRVVYYPVDAVEYIPRVKWYFYLDLKNNQSIIKFLCKNSLLKPAHVQTQY